MISDKNIYTALFFMYKIARSIINFEGMTGEVEVERPHYLENDLPYPKLLLVSKGL